MAIPATNRFNIEANRPSVPIDFNAPYAPTTQTYHGFAIQVDGVTIGRITDWTPVSLDRNMQAVYELNPKTWGQPVDQIPGAATTFNVSYSRAEVWGEEIEKAFGAADVYSLLIDQNAPFTIDEFYSRGLVPYRLFRYLGCWFSSKSVDAFTGDGDGIIRISGDITFVNRVKII